MTDPTPAAPLNAGALPDPMPTRPPRSQWQDVWRQFRSHTGAMVGLALFLFIVLGVAIGPWIWSASPTDIPPVVDMIKKRDMRPVYTLLWDSGAKTSWAHPLGTDNLARDNLARLMFGGRVSIAVGLTAMALSILLGTLIGVMSA